MRVIVNSKMQPKVQFHFYTSKFSIAYHFYVNIFHSVTPTEKKGILSSLVYSYYDFKPIFLSSRFLFFFGPEFYIISNAVTIQKFQTEIISIRTRYPWD